MKTGEPWYFLEELYPAFGNLVPRDIAAREILRLCEMEMGIDGKAEVFLDVSHLPEDKKKKLQSILTIYQKFTGEDPRQVPMKIFPAVHYSMGGGWVDWPVEPYTDTYVRFCERSGPSGNVVKLRSFVPVPVCVPVPETILSGTGTGTHTGTKLLNLTTLAFGPAYSMVEASKVTQYLYMDHF